MPTEEKKTQRIRKEDHRKRHISMRFSSEEYTELLNLSKRHNQSMTLFIRTAIRFLSNSRERHKNLRTEITKRRKENHDDRQKRRWNPEDIVKLFQSQLLDWIEQQLDEMST